MSIRSSQLSVTAFSVCFNCCEAAIFNITLSLLDTFKSMNIYCDMVTKSLFVNQENLESIFMYSAQSLIIFLHKIKLISHS